MFNYSDTGYLYYEAVKEKEKLEQDIIHLLRTGDFNDSEVLIEIGKLVGLDYDTTTNAWEKIPKPPRPDNLKETFGDIYKEFLEESGISESNVDDYRPCTEPFYPVLINGAIIVWLKGGSRVIYLPKSIKNDSVTF